MKSSNSGMTTCQMQRKWHRSCPYLSFEQASNSLCSPFPRCSLNTSPLVPRPLLCSSTSPCPALSKINSNHHHLSGFFPPFKCNANALILWQSDVQSFLWLINLEGGSGGLSVPENLSSAPDSSKMHGSVSQWPCYAARAPNAPLTSCVLSVI